MGKKMNYEYGDLRSFCEENKMNFDEDFLKKCDSGFKGLGLSQAQVDVIVFEYADKVRKMWDRGEYTLWQRIKLSLYWLGVG